MDTNLLQETFKFQWRVIHLLKFNFIYRLYTLTLPTSAAMFTLFTQTIEAPKKRTVKSD